MEKRQAEYEGGKGVWALLIVVSQERPLSAQQKAPSHTKCGGGGNCQVQKAWGESEVRRETGPEGQCGRENWARTSGDQVREQRGGDVSKQGLMAQGKEFGIYSDVEGSQWVASRGRVSWADLCLIRSDKQLAGDQTARVETAVRRELPSQAWCSSGLSRATAVPDSECIVRAEPTGRGDGWHVARVCLHVWRKRESSRRMTPKLAVEFIPTSLDSGEGVTFALLNSIRKKKKVLKFPEVVKPEKPLSIC